MSPERLLPANPDILDGVDDLIQMSYLNEPSVLYNLQLRYSRDLIYVSTTQESIVLYMPYCMYPYLYSFV
jgi:myosin heavy subunit